MLTIQHRLLVSLSVLFVMVTGRAASAQVKTAAELVMAVNNGAPSAVVVLAAGTFELTAPLRPKVGMKIKGAGPGLTTIRNASTWAPGGSGLSDDEGATLSGIQCDKYLINLAENTTDVSLSEMTLTGPELHGAICGVGAHRLEVVGVEIRNFLWSGLRAFAMDDAHIYNNSFLDAGNKSMVTSGSSGGGLFLTYTQGAQIHDNRFKRSAGNDYYGIKGREARSMHIYNNSIDTDFAIELPFENDHFVEIDHNYLGGTISIPKYAGGTFPEGGYSFHVHHNYFKSSYSFEYQRNGIEIDHNLFDFDLKKDYGNLISSFDSVAAPGGTSMHDNLIRNPGRGLYWNEGVYNNFKFYNNHIIAETTVTPRTEGLFDFQPAANGADKDWATIEIRDNVFELKGTARPLLRNTASAAAKIENNTLAGVTDVASYPNVDTGKPKGPLEPLSFCLGAQQEWTILQWTLSKSSVCPPTGNGGRGTGGAGGAGPDASSPAGGAMAGGAMAGGAGDQVSAGVGGAAGSVSGAAGLNADTNTDKHVQGDRASCSCSLVPTSAAGRVGPNAACTILMALGAFLVRRGRARRSAS